MRESERDAEGLAGVSSETNEARVSWRRNYRDLPPSRGRSWSRIRLKSEWWQFDDGQRLKTEDGFCRFDYRAFNVSAGLFEPVEDFTYGHIDLQVVARLLPALRVIGDICILLEAHDGEVRFKYTGQARLRVGIEHYARGLIEQHYPQLHTLTFDALHVRDHLDAPQI